MRLPDPLYAAVKRISAPHARWHEARDPERRRLRGLESEFPGLIDRGAGGSGAQFLEYHRKMLLELEPVLRERGPGELSVRPWREIPYWLSQFFSWAQPGYLSGALGRLREIVVGGSPDELGRFLETPPSAQNPFSGLHEVAHALIAIYERHRFGADYPGLDDAGMGSPETSPHNEHFWGLHGWIDDLYARTLAGKKS